MKPENHSAILPLTASSHVSIIIPTFNRGKHLGAILTCLSRQTQSSFQVLVVNDGSTDNTEEVVNGYRRGADSSIVLISQPNKGRSGARNEGVKHAQNDLLIFVDDDLVLSVDFVEKHIAHHRKHPNSILTGPANLDPQKTQNDFQHYKCYLEGLWEKQFRSDGFPQKISFDNFRISSANLSMSKKTFEEVGGFDERLKSAVDFDFAARALIKGITIYYDTAPMAWHNDDVTLEKYIRRHREYVKADQDLLKIHPEYADLFPSFSGQVKEAAPGLLKKYMRTLFKQDFFVSFVKNSGLFLKLPDKIKFRIYDWVLAAHSV